MSEKLLRRSKGEIVVPGRRNLAFLCLKPRVPAAFLRPAPDLRSFTCMRHNILETCLPLLISSLWAEEGTCLQQMVIEEFGYLHSMMTYMRAPSAASTT